MLLLTLPTLSTERLILRPFTGTDAGMVEELAGNPEIARYTANIPHPYPVGGAAKWIATHLLEYLEEKAIVLAIQKKNGPVVGAVQLTLEMEHRRAELGYWIGETDWGRGYATEACLALLEYGFAEWKLERIFARYLDTNPASGRVLQKIGMTYEGTLRAHTWHEESRADLVFYGVLASERQQDG